MTYTTDKSTEHRNARYQQRRTSEIMRVVRIELTTKKPSAFVIVLYSTKAKDRKKSGLSSWHDKSSFIFSFGAMSCDLYIGSVLLNTGRSGASIAYP